MLGGFSGFSFVCVDFVTLYLVWFFRGSSLVIWFAFGFELVLFYLVMFNCLLAVCCGL